MIITNSLQSTIADANRSKIPSLLLIYKIIILKWRQARCDTNTFSWEKLDMREQVIITSIEEKLQMHRFKF
jgi:hypothetical protein